LNQPGHKIHRKGFTAIVIGAIAIAFAPIFVRLSDTGLVATAFYRVALALPVFWLAVAVGGRQPSAGSPRLGILALAGVFFALDMAAWHWSIGLTTVANATLLANFAPFVVALGAHLFLKEALNRRLLGILVFSIFGAALLIGPNLSFSKERLVGDLMGLLTAVFYGAYQLTVRYLRRSTTPLMIMAWSGIPACLVLLAISLASGESMVPGSAKVWWVLIGLALISHVAGQGMIAYGFGHLPATIASISLLIQPLVATVVAWKLFQETLSLQQLIGAAIMLSGIYFANRLNFGTVPEIDRKQGGNGREDQV